MRTIASLLFGRDAGGLLDLIAGEGGVASAAAAAARRPTACCGPANGAAARPGGDRRIAPLRGRAVTRRGIIIRNGRI